ncbi:MAG: imidazoleglycerol-phosphate dehydratase HisB [Candidatus Lokiarchaeota archaeon]|nr:imidazoleglycerol-phosphate dehydratase HisB [Candidatus Lokiarchaeota archaeon]
MLLRKAKIERNTSETQIKLEINLDGQGDSDIQVNNKFLTHMLTTLAKHSLIDIKLNAIGDLDHHLVEDVGIALGVAFKKVLKDKKGIKRFASAIVPMDESLARIAIDLGGRGYCVYDLDCNLEIVEDLPVSLVEHFFEALASNSEINLHIKVLDGKNDHHKLEAVYKALAICLKDATRIEKRIQDRVPSTKGVL